MSQEEEFSRWLRRSEKLFQENLRFAVKSWQSAEFTLTLKYEIVLQWLTEQDQLTDEEILEDDFKELLKLRAPPGLISQKVKEKFVEWMLKQANEKAGGKKKWCTLLYLLMEFELLQELYRMNYELHCRAYGQIFTCYEKFLLSMESTDEHFLSTSETDFFASVLNSLKEVAKRCGNIVLFGKAYDCYALQPMGQVLLVLQTLKSNFFQEFLEIENLIYFDVPDQTLICRILKLDLPIMLLCLEGAILKRKGFENFLKSLLKYLFCDFLYDSFEDMDPSISLTLVAFVIEMLRRHGVGLNVQIDDDHTAIKFLGEHIFQAVKKRKEKNLKEVLMLLCATFRLNPHILDQNVFKITSWIILAPKSKNIEEQELFEEYLLLLMDMFRRLGRAEKFIIKLLRDLNECLKSVHWITSKKRKSFIDFEQQTPEKKMKLVKGYKINHPRKNHLSKYLNILFQDFFKSSLTKRLKENTKISSATSFSKLQNLWPSNPVGLSFSKMISGLVSKPSLNIWKSLLYALKEVIESLKHTTEINENSLFQLDFQSALLSQYFAGSKLVEQADKFLVELQQQRVLTFEVLKLFGQFLLTKQPPARILSAFLELVYFSSNFELLLVYYRSDGCNDESLQHQHVVEKLHSFLTAEEWLLLHHQVLNCGKLSCKHLLRRIEMQKAQGLVLLLTGEKDIFFKTADAETINSLSKTHHAEWYLRKLPRMEKTVIADFIITNPELRFLVVHDLELLEFAALGVYETICKFIYSESSLLKCLFIDFDKFRYCEEVTACELLLKELFNVIINRTKDENHLTQISLENTKTSLDILSHLPLGQLRRQRKTIIFALHLCLFRDLKAAQEEQLAGQALEILKDLLHFGQQVLIFKYLPTSLLLKLLPVQTCWDLYEFLFSTIKNEEKGTDQFLLDLSNILKEAQSSSNMKEEHRKLLLCAIETIASLSGSNAKQKKRHLNIFLKIFSDYLMQYFISGSNATSKKDKKFVQKTLGAFAIFVSVVLTKTSKDKENNKTTSSLEMNDFKFEVDEEFRRISKIYIGYSMSYRNPHALRLMQVTLNHRELLHLDQDEIEFVLTNYWSQINEDLKDGMNEQNHCTKSLESAVKIIIGNKTNEDLLLLLKTIAKNDGGTNYGSILRILSLIAKCPFSTIKGAIFNEEYKEIAINMVTVLKRDAQQNVINYDIIEKLLITHKIVLDNKMIPISIDSIDSILSLLININIKNFALNDSNINKFHVLHLAMTEVCSSLIKHRHILLVDRIPQYMHIFKDLLQALIWYKSELQKDTVLPPNEIDNLSELSLKLETLMYLISHHRQSIKRVAPFVLTFIINLMVSNKRPTTLYKKIKTHIENICYELIAICDHRVDRFILRCTNEAGGQLYKLLVKDYQKYHKFKGKV